MCAVAAVTLRKIRNIHYDYTSRESHSGEKRRRDRRYVIFPHGSIFPSSLEEPLPDVRPTTKNDSEEEGTLNTLRIEYGPKHRDARHYPRLASPGNKSFCIKNLKITLQINLVIIFENV